MPKSRAFRSSASTWMRDSSLSMLVAARGRGHVVVGHGDGLFGRADLAAGHAQPLEGLRAGHFVDQVAVDVQQAGSIGCSSTRWASQILS
jgi:hypothetical protein